MGINVLSLFDGISCGMIALERAGIHVDNYYSSEISESAITISKNNYPNIIRLGDVTKLNEDYIKSLDIDLVLAGSPCQGFSRQGKGLNFNDPRSKLFFNFVEILGWVKESNCNAKFILENVNMKKEWESLISEIIGVEAIDINSDQFVGQNRPRLYWTNISGVTNPRFGSKKLIDSLEDVELLEYVEHDGIKFCKSISENSIKLVSNVDGEVRISQATKKGYIVAKNGDGVNISFPLSKSRRGRVLKQKSSCLDTQCNICVYHNGAIRRLTVSEMEALQTLPKGYTNFVSDRKRIEAIGNGWTVDVIAYILSFMNIENESNCENIWVESEEVLLGNKEVEQFKWCI